MNPYEKLAEALHERLAVIRNRQLYAHDPSAHLRQLKQISETISALRHQLPTPVDPQLQHYLDRSSFDKALAWLEQLSSKE